MAKYRQRLDLSEMSMSATLAADKKGTSYTVKKIGKKLQKHGGLKVGEKLSDTQADDLRDSGIKTKFKPYKEQNDPFAAETTYNELEVTDWELDQHDGNLQELSPKTISSYQKKAGQQYRDAKAKRPMSPDYAQGLADAGKMRQKDADSEIKTYDTMKKRGKGLAMSKGKGMKKEEIVNERNTGVKIADYKIKMKMPKEKDFKPIAGHPDYKGPANPLANRKPKLNQSPGNMRKSMKEGMFDYKSMAKDYLSKNKGKKHSVGSVQKHLQKTAHEYDTRQSVADTQGHNAGETYGHVKKMLKPKPMKSESIQRRMDRKTIIATDPATGRKVVKIAPKKEIDIGKGKMEAYVAEISDKMKMNYIKKANKQISRTERMRDYQNQQMDKKPGSFTKSDKDFVNKMYDKDTLKRRKGVRMAKSKLGEGAFKEMDTVKKEKQRLARMKKPEYSKKEIRMGKGVAFDKRYKQGNYSGAYKTINKIKKGLADHPKVADALKRANEQFIQGE